MENYLLPLLTGNHHHFHSQPPIAQQQQQQDEALVFEVGRSVLILAIQPTLQIERPNWIFLVVEVNVNLFGLFHPSLFGILN